MNPQSKTYGKVVHRLEMPYTGDELHHFGWNACSSCSWDNQFYLDIAKQGSYLLQIDCDTQQGGLTLNEKLHVDFGQEPHGPVRVHEMRFPGGDSTSDIWV